MKNMLKRFDSFINEKYSKDDISQGSVDCIPYLKKINSEIPWQVVLNWFNENDIDYYGMRDLDMYIRYIEENSK